MDAYSTTLVGVGKVSGAFHPESETIDVALTEPDGPGTLAVAVSLTGRYGDCAATSSWAEAWTLEAVPAALPESMIEMVMVTTSLPLTTWGALTELPVTVVPDGVVPDGVAPDALVAVPRISDSTSGSVTPPPIAAVGGSLGASEIQRPAKADASWADRPSWFWSEPESPWQKTLLPDTRTERVPVGKWLTW